MSIKACWIPGLPHLLSPERSESWASLNCALHTLSKNLENEKYDCLVLYSTQWLSVLGTSFQTHPNPKGIHVDENWYEFGNLPFDLKIDTETSLKLSDHLRSKNLPTKNICYESFPIDTGTIVAQHFLKSKVPLIIVSSWVYGSSETSFTIGKEMASKLKSLGKNPIFVVSSLLTARFHPIEIDPSKDKISSAVDDEWNKKILGYFEKGDFDAIYEVSKPKDVILDMQFNGFHWLRGAINQSTGKVLGYEPIWGGGASVIEFRDHP